MAGTTQSDTQVTTIVQQLDAQGPAVVDRISTQFADLACTPDNARQLVEALHSGTSVTLNANGKSATFNPTGAQLGYGEAYIALALAAEALRNAGVTSCATPDQWQSVLMGGPLAAAGTTSTSTSQSASASSSSRFPGILALHSQGQGWGQIAQTTNVQLGQVVSTAHSSLNLDSSGSGLSPTGKTSAEMNQGRPSTSTTPSASSPDTSSSAGTTDATNSSRTGHEDRGKHKGKAKGKGDRDKADKDDSERYESGSSQSSPRPDR